MKKIKLASDYQEGAHPAIMNKLLASFQATKNESYTVVRFATSWATTEKAITDFEQMLPDISQ